VAVLSPFLALPLVGWLGGGGMRRASLLSILPAGLTAYFVYALRLVNAEGGFVATIPWAPSLGLALSFRFDGLSLLFAILIAGVGALIVPYAATYLDGHPHAARFQVTLFAFMGSMLGLVLSDNVLLLFVFWELTGFTSYLLIGFEHDRPEARRAALQALLVTGAGGLALLAAAIMFWQTGGTASLTELLAAGPSLADRVDDGAIVWLVLLAAFTKSAQFPFHFWLPNAMQAPSPVSAYLHSATMVKAGVYLVARMTPLLGGSQFWSDALVLAGLLTMVGGAYRALIETDLKRVLAYSTIGALGVLMFLLGLKSPDAVMAAVLHLIAHAGYKGALFLVAGAIDHETGTRDVSALSGLRHKMPRTAIAAGLAAASMAGLPLFFGFIAKEELYDAIGGVVRPGLPSAVLIVASVGVSACLGGVGLIAGVGPFIGRAARGMHAHEPPTFLWLSPLVLGLAGLVAGVAPSLIEAPVSLAARSILPGTAPEDLALWHGFGAALLLSAVTLAAAVGLFTLRDRVRRIAWPRALHTERLYSGALSALDGFSRRLAPLLQSASLRSYVLIILLTVVTLVGTALALGRVLPTPRRSTPVQLHEGVIGGLIALAAVTAATARSNMTAVLSLGAVGYGVALLYALFGAPDLAITQFAVETLTVVIFVLVFYQLRGFGDLSSPLVKARDALVAGAAGVLVTTLVLYIGASGTTSRLAAYFIDAAPRLAHGTNVVNVILVDFRGFDTLGEITVLVSVAVGVRALLRIGKERRP
jgi:multicomponent Na+:H+ antiporter subunit A